MIDWYDLIIYLVLWTTFGTIHTIFASNTMKRVLPFETQTYRIIFNIFAGFIFLLLLNFLPSLSSILVNISDLGFGNLILFLVIFGLGSLITIIGGSKWNLLGFIGFRKEDDPLNTQGIYAFSRHPVYTGIILLFLSAVIIEISTGSLSWLIGGGGYFVIGSYFEENKLKSQFPEYLNYEKDVGRFFPWNKRHFDFLFNNY